ncbi:MAG: DUF1648 domain-containing protein [Gammaproteobacteria bacterium]|nr:DUF1648 domain-containing protein [Gammaproteobacteria bacterium]
MQLSHKLCFALAALSIVQAAYYYPQLPDTMASHFDGAGVVNDWSSPVGFFAVVLLVVALNLFVFVALPHLIVAGRLRVNLPHRDYWLAPERREQTRARIAGFLGWFGVASLLLAVAVVQLVMDANLAQAPLSPVVCWLLLAYFVYVLVSLARLFWQFRKPAV